MVRSPFAIALVLALFSARAVAAQNASPAPSISPSAAPSASASAMGPVASNATLPQFAKEADAQVHCPHDKVVWLNLRNNLYFHKDSQWWGVAKKGSYVCQREADAAGDHEYGGSTYHKPGI
jgi:hypothetical protein